jgi:methanogenic corrinoid protein MtbC1
MKVAKERLDALFDAVVSGNTQRARKIAEKAVSEGLSADAALERMNEAMQVVDRKYEQKEYFIVDVASSASAMREAFKIFQPHLTVESTTLAGKVVIGSLKGNIQNMGKDIVVATLRAAGFQVIDVGVNVSPHMFVETAMRERAQIIAISISVDETVFFLDEVVNRLQKENMTDKVKVVIGGRAVSEKIRREYHVDAYAKDAWDCVKEVRKLLERLN